MYVLMGASPVSRVSTAVGCWLCMSLLLLLCSLSKGYALTQTHYYLSVHVISLLPSPVCTASSAQDSMRKGAASLKVVHRHGSCSHLVSHNKSTTVIVPEAAEVLLSQDQSRVDSIQSRLASNSGQNALKGSQATLPARSDGSLGTSNYFVIVGLGTPKQQLSLIFDTGSDLTWTQCQPCAVSCYKQQDPIFDPSVSTTYKNISCTSPQCPQRTSAAGAVPDCFGNTCAYGIQYLDRSFSIGFLGSDTLTLTTDAFPEFLFGCGQNNSGLFGRAAGLLGLGRDKLSVVSQTASKYGKYFAYCLPTSSSIGFLAFGKGMSSKTLKFTPLLIDLQQSSFYFIDIVAIKCGPTLLPIPQSVFKTAGTIIDSGTVFTRLPSSAYTALRTEFRKQMSKYPMAPAWLILDTCYDLSNYTTVSFPRITFYFSGNTEVPLAATGILYAKSASQVCLAFAGNSDDSIVGIFGNVQQQTLDVVYDVAGGKLGFGQNGCS